MDTAVALSMTRARWRKVTDHEDHEVRGRAVDGAVAVEADSAICQTETAAGASMVPGSRCTAKVKILFCYESAGADVSI